MQTIDWQDALHKAIHESDPQTRDEKIQVAVTAIFSRISGFPGPTPLEEEALFDALGAVRALRSARRISK